MTYQSTRFTGMGYVGRNTRQHNNAASATERTRRSKGRSAEKASYRAEIARRNARAEKEEAYRIARMEHERARQARRIAYYKEYDKRMKRELKAAKAEARREARLEARREEEALRRREIKVEKKRAPMGVILGILIAFVLLMGVVYSFSQISESSSQLSDMKAELAQIRAEAEKYALEIEAKNDLGVIEDKAVNELNMVKEGSVQKKYITVSDGDRIVIAQNSDDAPEGYGGILSGLSAAFENIMDYVR
ncbi:MAG: septum formation initiator family protein [Clostridia bacterium]|nr:septum formation initiator family protein [Clostridia bacterium]